MDCVLLADFTPEPFVRALQSSGELPAVAVRSAPIAGIFGAPAAGTFELAGSPADFAIVWTSADKVSSTLSRGLLGETLNLEAIRRDVESFANALIAAAAGLATKGVLVMNWSRPAWRRGGGIRDARPGQGIADAVRRMNVWLSDFLDRQDKVHILDSATWLNRSGADSHDPKLWYLAKIPYSTRATEEAVVEVKAAFRALLGQSRKLVILDLDDTLWGGTVGEDGWQHLRIGGHDAVGEAFVDFQRGLKALTKRGVLLAICSKNTEAIALEAIAKHPEMILRPNDFVTTRINWKDKVENILEIVSEINIALDAVVFIDDDPTQRLRVKQALPELLVPEWPANKLLYQQALERLTCFDSVGTSAEDRARTAMYHQEHQRRSTATDAQSREAWLSSLNLEIVVEPLNSANLKRTAQLLNKTNQMNLSTRRLTESELVAWAAKPGHAMFVARVIDRFGDYGLTAIVSTAVTAKSATIVDFVLSCRVLDRGVEEAMLHHAANAVTKKGVETLVAPLVPTARNTPCRQFFDERSGFERISENLYSGRLSKAPPLPEHLKFEVRSDDGSPGQRSAALVK